MSARRIYVRLFDFKLEDTNKQIRDISSDEETAKQMKNFHEYQTIIKMFGMGENGETYCLNVVNYQPFFYVKIMKTIKEKDRVKEEKTFKRILENDIGRAYSNDIVSIKTVKKKKLYGFDNSRFHNFYKITFTNTKAFSKARSLWYTKDDFNKRMLSKEGYLHTKLYEAKLPPLLRMFHIKDISPSGWVSFKANNVEHDISIVDTTCDNEYWISYQNLVSEREKEDTVPLKVCSFDIEASSSHGDFPLAKKTYLKMCREIITYWRKHNIREKDEEEKTTIFKNLVFAAFDYIKNDEISKLYIKTENENKRLKNIKTIQDVLDKIVIRSISHYIKRFYQRKKQEELDRKNKWGRGGGNRDIEIDIDGNDMCETKSDRDDIRLEIEKLEKKERDADEEDTFYKPKIKKIYFKNKTIYNGNIVNLLDSKEDVGMISLMLDEIFIQYTKEKMLPEIKGDKVTFIGSTFMRITENEQYKNNIIVLNSCSECKDVPNSEVVECRTEKDVLVKWSKLIEKEDPDIIIGYNIFGFDYKFMLERTEELKCKSLFLKPLSRIKDDRSKVVNTSIKIASGTHDLTYIKMNGRLQLDLYNYFRREVNLPSYKLDYVASHFIGDMIKNMEVVNDKTKIYSKNLTGLLNGHYICFEILGHSSDMYKNGKKYIVSDLNLDEKSFTINGNIVEDLTGKKVRWCLAKDDVSPQDIFNLTKKGPDERAIIAKYCFQDCNLVHNLMKKNDIFTGIVEIANICYVPIDFIIMRGQGIKLLSFIAKKASEKDTLMPVLDVEKGDSSYEGAICLKPYCGLYIDNPVAVVDYSSLYPSCMISENISHDSKVWTKEYDLKGNIVIDPETKQEKITGERDENGDFIYDNLPGFKYVNVTYDRYEWQRKKNSTAVEKVKVGTKTCRFAQFPENKKGIMPTVLQELLFQRKSTRKFIKYKTVITDDGEEFSGLIQKKDGIVYIENQKEYIEVDEDSVVSIKDTYDDVMKNIYDKRQLGLKVTANSLYGQTGAKTSSFYEMDIAASTTATGRKLLIYAKKIIEGIYGNKICDTKYGDVRSRAKVVYGDTDSCFMAFNLEELNGDKIVGKKALDITIQLAIEAGETATKFLKAPHDLEYEKTFDPFLLLSKKRYVGMLYETDINKCKRKSMGIVLKRRDNAPVVKDIYGGIIDIIMKEKDIEKAVKFTKKFLKDIINEKIPLDKLIITKSLREFYKNPDSIAHKVLADRMGKRDPGNKPSTGSRIPFVYIKTKKKVKLQGDKIEHPNYIKTNNLKPDYRFYITNQIMKPVTQIYALVLEDLREFKKKLPGFNRKMRALARKWRDNEKKLDEYSTKERNKYVKELIFDEPLNIYGNKINGQKTLFGMF